MKPIYFIIFSLLILSCNNGYKSKNQEVSFVTIKEGHFIQGDTAFYFVGTNYWYGPSLGLMDDTVRGLQRLRQELDFLKSQGITNLRICAAVEGEGTIQGVPRIVPVFQQSPGVFVTDNLKGLDRLLEEMSRKEMKAVLFFSNNWEWSGGFLQYLYWNKAIDSTAFYNRLSWEKLRDVVSGFYSCEPCIQQYEAQVKAILTRKNSINGLKYIDDPTIFAWQLANEPRPMRPAAIDAYKNWIARTAKMIKSIDTNHLVTIGVEGFIGTENMDVYEAIHADSNIDYGTIHIWPRNWQWYKDLNDVNQQKKALDMTKKYITDHMNVMKKIGKPLVIEEFGYPRDNNSFEPSSTTRIRDSFYTLLFNELSQSQQNKGLLAGCNFWAFGGEARPIPGQKFWKPGDDFMGDPPMEEQGLYSVFDSDSSTWKVINAFIKTNGELKIEN